MKRREFMVKSAAIGVIAALPVNILGNVSNDIGDTIIHRGITLRWTGWMGCVDSTILVGRWFGLNIENKHAEFAYQASYPGSESKYRLGATHDISSKENQIIPSIDEFIKDPSLPYKLKLETLSRVKNLIDEDLNKGAK